MAKMDFDKLPNFLKNLNSVLEDDIEGVSWLHGHPPDYSLVNKLYMAERTKVHAPRSLEDMMTNLIKNWEKELSHKTDVSQWKTVDVKIFQASMNGGRFWSLGEIAKVGAYNMFLGDSEFYCASLIPNPTESHNVFRTAIKNGFALEILEVYTPPPKVVFKWRHWGKFEGEVKCPMRNKEILNLKPKGNKVEIHGTTVMMLNDKFQITQMEFFFRADTMMDQMVGLSVV